MKMNVVVPVDEKVKYVQLSDSDQSGYLSLYILAYLLGGLAVAVFLVHGLFPLIGFSGFWADLSQIVLILAAIVGAFVGGGYWLKKVMAKRDEGLREVSKNAAKLLTAQGITIDADEVQSILTSGNGIRYRNLSSSPERWYYSGYKDKIVFQIISD